MDFSKSVPSSTVCTWFYAFYVINAVIAVACLLALAVTLFSAKGGVFKALFGAQAFGFFIKAAIAATNMMFFYIICDRALLGEKNSE